MKKLQLLLFAAAGCLALGSCDTDDDNNNNVSENLTGTWELTRLAAPNQQDYDGDGDSNTNLVLEGNCYNSSWISFHDDGTYDQSLTTNVLAEGGASLDCDTQISSGTYTQTGNTVTTTRTSGEGSLNMTFVFDAGNHTLTAVQNDGSYAGWNSTTSLFANATGNLELVFTKYTDNDQDNGNGQNDDDNTNTTAFADVVGNFDLSSFIVGTAQNLDGDGDSSANLMTESNCYADSNITFNSNGTYSQTVSHSILSGGGASLTCDSQTTTGTWSRNGNTVVTRRVSGSTTLVTTYTLNSSNHTLTHNDEFGEYPIWNSVTSLFANATGMVNLTYTKDQQ